jgi:hypothetical protein
VAILHKATLSPTKVELLNAWLPTRDWYTGGPGEVTRLAGFRFDDPAGAVGVETMLVKTGDGPTHQIPLTYRDAPLPDGDDWLVTTAEHSALGRRWIYDAIGDPVYAATLATAILANTGQADLFIKDGDHLERREFEMSITSTATRDVPVVGSIQRVVPGNPTLIVTDTVELTVLRRLGTELTGAVLTGTWPGQARPLPLASAASMS